MFISILCNAAIVLCTFFAICHHLRTVSMRVLFRFFTVLSNVLCAFASLVVLLCSFFGNTPTPVLILKYVGTAAVSVTMLTVFLFLGPTTKSWKGLLTGPDLFLHLICPLLAIISYVFFEQIELPFAVTLLGTLPVPLYGFLYLKKVIYTPAPNNWDDFYGFNRTGKWPISFLAMILGAFLISMILWAI